MRCVRCRSERFPGKGVVAIFRRDSDDGWPAEPLGAAFAVVIKKKKKKALPRSPKRRRPPGAEGEAGAWQPPAGEGTTPPPVRPARPPKWSGAGGRARPRRAKFPPAAAHSPRAGGGATRQREAQVWGALRQYQPAQESGSLCVTLPRAGQAWRVRKGKLFPEPAGRHSRPPPASSPPHAPERGPTHLGGGIRSPPPASAHFCFCFFFLLQENNLTAIC
ncbi:unnamed protein product [Lepidochelys olivacea]